MSRERHEQIAEMVKTVSTEALKLLPVLVRWVQERINAGEGVDVIRRDIEDLTDRVLANRAKVDAALDKLKEE